MKRFFPSFFAIFFVSCLFFPLPGESAEITVQGIGYPPIRARDRVQARLMARRAAVLDAYRNALRKVTTPEDDERYFEHLSGFIRGAVVVGEDYLSDGSVEVTMKVSLRDMDVASSGAHRLEKGGDEQQDRRKPASITIEQWYEVIDKWIRYDGR